MKLVYVGLVLLCALTLACAATGTPSRDSQSNPATPPSGTAADGQVSTPASAPGAQSGTILSRAEADSLTVKGDSQMAQSGVDQIRVGEIGSRELIYILVVVLLVVLIVSVL